MDRLNEYYKNSLLNNLCSEYKDYWRAASHDKESLFRLAVSQQSLPHMTTYAYEGKGLTREYILKEFGKYINGKYTAIDVDGVQGGYKTELYVGFEGDLSLSDDVFCAMWCDIPTMEIKATKAVKIYLTCGSVANIVCEGYNSIIVMLFDDSKVCLEDIDEESTVTVYRYSRSAEVSKGSFCLSRNIRIFEKELKL